MIGDGVDRHLFALYVASVGLKIDSEFLTQYKNARWTESKLSGWELSTRLVKCESLLLLLTTAVHRLAWVNYSTQRSTRNSSLWAPDSDGLMDLGECHR